MLKQKMSAVMNEVNCSVTEREELVHCIALALLTRMNLFVLGGTGQAKSYVIDLFKKRIQGARQYETLMSKGIDREELFGRLDLASIIPGNVSKSKLMYDPRYKEMYDRLSCLVDAYRTDPLDEKIQLQMKELQQAMEDYRKSLAELYGGNPEINTLDKIPNSHIAFLDEIFKANEGILNALLKALNERRYTNEGVTIDIPVISFFSASNEIPNFNNPEEKILRPLYDRFQLKFVTEYVQEKDNRLKTLKNKQSYIPDTVSCSITLEELCRMQEEVRQIPIPDNINELMDTILCELRNKNIHVSDRTFFDYGLAAQAQAWLSGNTAVGADDLKILVHYLWSTPEEIPIIQDVLKRLCENPLGDKINGILAAVYEIRDRFESGDDKNKELLKLKTDILVQYDALVDLKNGISSDDSATASINSAIESVETISRKAYEQTSFTYIRLPEIKELQKLSERRGA